MNTEIQYICIFRAIVNYLNYGKPLFICSFVITKDCMLDFSIYTILVHLIIHYLDSNIIKGIFLKN
jgi:hypothetical protein